ncbi:hypothetical protein D3C85_281820 [compost metagenome]
MLGDRAEGAAAEAAAHDVHAEADHFPRGDLGRAVVAAVLVGVARVRAARIRQVEHVVHLGRGERNGRRVDPHVARRGALAVRLHERAGVAGIGFEVQHAVGVGVEHRIAAHLLVRRQADHRAVARRHGDLAAALQRRVGHEVQRLDGGVDDRTGGGARGFGGLGDGLRLVFLRAGGAVGLGLVGHHQVRVDVRLDAARLVDAGGVDLEPGLGRFAAHIGGAAHVGDLLHRLLGGQAVRDLDDGALGVAVQQQVALGVDDDGAAHLVRPVVVVRDAAQAAFDAAEDDRHVVPGFLAALRIHDGRAVGARAADVAGGVGVVAADLPVGRVAVDHRIHVAGRDAEEQVRLAQHLEGLGALPVGLRDDAHAKALRLEHAADDRHAEAGVVDVGVARDHDDVAAVPAERVHLLARGRQELGRAETGRPVLAVAGQRLGGTRKKGDVDGGVHRWERTAPGRRLCGQPSILGFSSISVALKIPCPGMRGLLFDCQSQSI